MTDLTAAAIGIALCIPVYLLIRYFNAKRRDDVDRADDWWL